MEILDAYLWTMKSSSKFGSHPDPNLDPDTDRIRAALAELCDFRVLRLSSLLTRTSQVQSELQQRCDKCSTSVKSVLVCQVLEDGVLSHAEATVYDVKVNFISRSQVSCSLPERYS